MKSLEYILNVIAENWENLIQNGKELIASLMAGNDPT
jgi:hypothetical protein